MSSFPSDVHSRIRIISVRALPHIAFIVLVGGCVSTGEQTQVDSRGFFNQTETPTRISPHREAEILVGYLNSSSSLAKEVCSYEEALETLEFNSSCLDRVAELKQKGFVSNDDFQKAAHGHMSTELLIFDSEWSNALVEYYAQKQ